MPRPLPSITGRKLTGSLRIVQYRERLAAALSPDGKFSLADLWALYSSLKALGFTKALKPLRDKILAECKRSTDRYLPNSIKHYLAFETRKTLYALNDQIYYWQVISSEMSYKLRKSR